MTTLAKISRAAAKLIADQQEAVLDFIQALLDDDRLILHMRTP